jgi:hypothetical protein
MAALGQAAARALASLARPIGPCANAIRIGFRREPERPNRVPRIRWGRRRCPMDDRERRELQRLRDKFLEIIRRENTQRSLTRKPSNASGRQSAGQLAKAAPSSPTATARNRGVDPRMEACRQEALWRGPRPGWQACPHRPPAAGWPFMDYSRKLQPRPPAVRGSFIA